MKELFTQEKINGREALEIFLLYEKEVLGSLNTEGALWETHRRFTLRQLRDFGYGKEAMEDLIMDEVREFIAGLESKEGASLGGIKELFSVPVINSLSRIVSGRRYHHHDPKLLSLASSLHMYVRFRLRFKFENHFPPFTNCRCC